MSVPECSISIGKFNHAILLKQLKCEISSEIEQRDIAIKNGAKGAITLTFENGQFLTANTNYDSLQNESSIKKLLVNNLDPVDNDIIIIGSDDSNYTISELVAKAAVLYTLDNHDNH